MVFLTWLGNLLLEFVWKKIVVLASGWLARLRRDKEIDKQEDNSVVPLKDAKTADEIDKAADSALDHL